MYYNLIIAIFIQTLNFIYNRFLNIKIALKHYLIKIIVTFIMLILIENIYKKIYLNTIKKVLTGNPNF